MNRLAALQVVLLFLIGSCVGEAARPTMSPEPPSSLQVTFSPTELRIWRTPEELVEMGFSRSRVVMMNEAHSGLERCIRTREIGRRILPRAHHVGVRHLAMEALWPDLVEEANHTRKLPNVSQGYLSQPEMRAFIQAALDLGWTLIAYEADTNQQPANLSPTEANNWREEEQARNLFQALQSLPRETKLLVWVGNSHHSKIIVEDWQPMGYQFIQMSGLNPFVIDQIVTVQFPQASPIGQGLVEQFAAELEALGGTAGFVREEAPSVLKDRAVADAFILSTQNELE